MININKIKSLALIGTLILTALSSTAFADFSPSNLVIICNKNFKESCELARFYSEKRKVPADNIIELNTKDTELIERADFNNEILEPIKSKLVEKKLVVSLKILVTFYGVPLTVTDADQDSVAAVDSELTLLKVQPGGAPLTNRLYNPLYVDDINSSSKISSKNYLALKGLTLVSRIDGPSPEKVRSMITDSIETENSQSLKGNFVIDSRGLSWDQDDEFAEYDKDLVKLARNIEVGSRFETEFDGNETLAEKTSNVGLYVGWYSLRNFENLYKFNKGAIGYHIASEEAASLREPEEKGWCKNLIANGVVATLGAVTEPYLDSFPKPNKFYTLLLSGKYQLVEIFFLSSKYLSWRVILIGDPLYKPISEKTARKEFDYDSEDYNELPVAPSVLMKN